MAKLNELFLFELQLLMERKRWSLAKALNQLGTTMNTYRMIEDNTVNTNRLMKLYEYVITINMISDVVERLNIAFDYAMKISNVSSYKVLARRMNKEAREVLRALRGDYKCLTEDFLLQFNHVFGNIFDTNWIMYGEGLMFTSTYHLLRRYNLRTTKEIEAAYERGVESAKRSVEHDNIFGYLRRKILLKKLMNPHFRMSTNLKIRKAKETIAVCRKGIEENKNYIESLKAEIKKKTELIEKNSKLLENYEKWLVGYAVLEMMDDIENL